MVTTTHSIHCGGTSGSHELAAAAEGEHCILVWLYRSISAGIHDNAESVQLCSACDDG